MGIKGFHSKAHERASFVVDRLGVSNKIYINLTVSKNKGDRPKEAYNSRDLEPSVSSSVSMIA